MDTKAVHKQPQVHSLGGALSGRVYKHYIPLSFLSYMISYFLKKYTPNCNNVVIQKWKKE